MARDSARDRIARLTQSAPAQDHAHTPAQSPVQAPVHMHLQPQHAMLRLHCYVEREQMAYLNRVSQEQGVDKAVFVRHIIEFYRDHGPLKEVKP